MAAIIGKTGSGHPDRASTPRTRNGAARMPTKDAPPTVKVKLLPSISRARSFAAGAQSPSTATSTAPAASIGTPTDAIRTR